MLPLISGFLKNVGFRIFCKSPSVLYFAKRMTHYPPGSGAVRGEGGVGTVKGAGGSPGRFATALEENFFYNKTREEIKKLKQQLKDLEEHHKKKEH